MQGIDDETNEEVQAHHALCIHVTVSTQNEEMIAQGILHIVIVIMFSLRGSPYTNCNKLRFYYTFTI